ncbi:hypothetical protein BKA83DRAFT_4044339, partial [Pisolithus microcarpus]
VYRIGDTFLRCFNMDRHALHRQTNMYYPFANLGDWEMANFLLQSNLSMREIDSYLSLSMMLLSFWTAKELCRHIEDLPKGPHWKIHIVPTHHPTTSPIELYWRDPLECIEALFNHPFYAGKMDYSPFHVFTAVGRIMRVYSEWMSSDGAWELQVKVLRQLLERAVGSLSSDSTTIILDVPVGSYRRSVSSVLVGIPRLTLSSDSTTEGIVPKCTTKCALSAYVSK